MNSNDILVEEILNRIDKSENVFIQGYNYESEILPIVKSLFEKGFIRAKPDFDEEGKLVQIHIEKLTSKGLKYLEQIKSNS